MSAARKKDEQARGRLLAAWEQPDNAGDAVGLIASTFTFDASFFEEELLARFLGMESAPDDGRAWLVEREERLGRTLAVVLADRRHVSRSTTLAWDLLPVPVPGSACQHAKITVLAWERWIRVVVGSANLTEAAYRRNLETFAVLDFVPEGDVPREVLTELLAYLRRMTERVFESRGGDGGARNSARDRALATIEAVAALSRKLDLPKDWPRSGTRVVPVLLEPERGEGVLTQMRAIWGDRPLPEYVWVLSPFWPKEDARGAQTLVRELVLHMAARGERALDLFAIGEQDAATQTWLLEAPESLREAAKAEPRLELSFHPVVAQQDGEKRPLHAKSMLWGRNEQRELLLIGSSNASASGLGLAGAPRNLEANLAFVPTHVDETTSWFGRCFPETPEVEDVRLIGANRDARDDEGGAPPPPWFFRWAGLAKTEHGAELQVDLDGDEPCDWWIAANDEKLRATAAEYARAGRPRPWRFAIDRSSPPPVLVDVHWKTGEDWHLGHLPVNALDAESRTRPDLWRDLDLDSLLELLASGGHVHRMLARLLRRREGVRGAGLAPELDPHRRVDTSGFLMQRIRRISRALEGLRVRLTQPVMSEAALEWRFQGPLSPTNLARRLVESAPMEEDRAFLVAELALVVGDAGRKVPTPGVRAELVRARYKAAVVELRALAPALPAAAPIGRYLGKAFQQAGAS